MLEQQNIKRFLQKATLQINLKYFLKIFKTLPLAFVIKSLKNEEIVGAFY